MRHASHNVSSSASGLPHNRFSRTVPENKTFFCSTMPIASRNAYKSYSLTSYPPTITVPDVASYKRGISCTSVLFAEPVPPKIPTVCPEDIFKLTWDNAYCCASVLYLNDTSFNSTHPFSTSFLPCCGEERTMGSSSTSTIRCALAKERVNSKNTLEIIIMAFNIWNT